MCGNSRSQTSGTQRVRLRHACEQGFTLVELLVVVAIIGILLAVAVPSYLGFQARASQKTAAADVQSAVAAAMQYGEDHNGSYAGMTPGTLKAFDMGLDIDHVVVSGAANDTYCLDKSVGGKVAKVTRGAAGLAGGKVVEGGGLC